MNDGPDLTNFAAIIKGWSPAKLVEAMTILNQEIIARNQRIQDAMCDPEIIKWAA